MSRVGITILRGERQGLDATMDERFGRAQAFLVVDAETGEVIDTIENPSVTAERGAGTGAASLMKSAGIDAVISGRFGPKALDALQALGIETWIAAGGVNAGQALTKFQEGGLEQVQS